METAPAGNLFRAVAIALMVGGLSACRFDPELGFVTLAEPAVEQQQAALNAGSDELAPVSPTAAPSPVVTLTLGPRWPLERTGEEIRQVLGNPQFVRNDALAQLWRYRTEYCILNLFLFHIREQEQVRATHAMYLQPSLEPLPNRGARNRCLSDLVRQAAAGTPPDQSTAGDLSVN